MGMRGWGEGMGEGHIAGHICCIEVDMPLSGPDDEGLITLDGVKFGKII